MAARARVLTSFVVFAVLSGIGLGQTDPQRYEAEIAAFEAADRTSFPPAGGVLFVGSSTIRLWTTLAEDFPGIPVINRGFGGAFIAEVLKYSDRIILPYRPKAIVLFIGGNDIADGRTPESVLKTFKQLTDKIHLALPETQLFYISINPTIARWNLQAQMDATNRLLADYIGGQAWISFIDSAAHMLGPDGKPRIELLADDSLHLNREGYRMLTSLVKPRLEQALKRALLPKAR